jgi:branched-chain amino acid transport system substrate-binding protein
MKVLRLIASLSLAGVVLSLATCQRSTQDVIKFGAVLSLTGPAAPYGQDNLRGLELAEETVNQEGGVKGHKLVVDVQDSAGDPAQAVLLAQRYAGDSSISAIIGPTRTGSTVAVAKLLPTLQIPMMSVGSTGDWVIAAGQDFNSWTFRSTRVDTDLVLPLLRYARDRRGTKRVALIYTANDDWAVSVKKLYESAIQQLGMQLVAEESQMAGDTDRSAQLTKIKSARPDALIVDALSSEAPSIANQAWHLGIRVQFLGTAGFTNPSTWKLADPGVLDGTLVAENYYPGSTRPAVRDFVERYRKKFGVDAPPYAAYAYDGVRLLALACRISADPRNRKEVRDALGSIHDFEGVLGKLTYHDHGDATKVPLILEIQKTAYIPLG